MRIIQRKTPETKRKTIRVDNVEIEVLFDGKAFHASHGGKRIASVSGDWEEWCIDVPETSISVCINKNDLGDMT